MAPVALCIAVALIACRGGGDAGARATRELGPCVAAIDRAGSLPPDQRLEALARGCAPACPGLVAWADARATASAMPSNQRKRWLEPGAAAEPASDASLALLRGCQALCSPDAERAVSRSPTGQRWPTLLSACGTARYGLSTDRADLASDTWLVLHRINDWLEGLRRAAVDDPQLPGQLEHATLRALFRLPLPARHAGAAYILPPSSRGRVSDAVIYVVVAPSGLRVGAVPLVRLRGPELELRPGPGGALPGQRVDEVEVGTTVADYAAYVERDLPRASAVPPLILADAGVPAARVIEVVGRLGRLGAHRAELGVAGDVALAHRVALVVPSPTTAPAPVIRVGDGKVDILGLSDDRTTTMDRLPDELRHFAAVNAPVRVAHLELAAPVTVADLVRVLDACADAHLDALIVSAATP
jgi:hypothetical protein